MFNFKAEFKRKENKFELSDCVIEKIIFISDDRYKNFKQNMLRDQQFIAENKEEMWVDENNITHGILVMSENSKDGVFIDSSGYDYARYTAFVPVSYTHLLIKYPERGTCLYKCGNERYLLQVKAPDYKAKLFGNAGGR